MDLEKFLNLLALVVGAIGSIYVLRGALAMTPELMDRQASSFWDYSVHHVDAVAGQKADAVAGVFYVVAAFAAAFLAGAFVPESVPMFRSRWTGVTWVLVVSAVLIATIHLTTGALSRHYRLAIGKVVACRYVDQVVSRNYVDAADVAALRSLGQDLLNLQISDGDKPDAVLSKVCKAVDRRPPELQITP